MLQMAKNALKLNDNASAPGVLRLPDLCP